MALPYPIAAGQTDARSPVDDNLMDSIRLDLDYLDSAINLGGGASFTWNINGVLSYAYERNRLDTQFLHSAQSFSRVRIAQNRSGLSGRTEIDIRYHTNPMTPITSIAHQMQLSTTSVGQVGTAQNTQSIANATATISTQSITRQKASLSVLSIIGLGSNRWRYNLSALPDADWRVGYAALFAGCTAGGNNGTFTILEVNQSGHPSIVVSNASGVAQTGAAGTAELQLFSYNFVNPVDAAFVVGENVVFASHTTGANNGNFPIHSVNDGGNNIVIPNFSGVVQAGVAGNATCSRWVYTYSAPINTDHYAVGERCRMASHSNANNNGDFIVRAINSSGNNLIISNSSGVAQAGAAGNATSLRWKYTFASDPSANITVGDRVVMASHSGGNNNGNFTIVLVNDTTANNIVVYNQNGLVQAGAAGTVTSFRKIISFASDQSLIYSTDSYVEFRDCVDTTYNALPNVLPFKVVQVNRGGGANYNIVIENASGGAQASPVGYISTEAKSIFTASDGNKPYLDANVLSATPTDILKATFTGSDVSSVVVPDNTYLGLYLLQVQSGYAADLSVILS